MKKISIYIYILIVLVIAVIGGSLIFYNNFWQTGTNKKVLVSDQKNQEISLIIDDGTGNLNNFTTKFVEEMTAFDLLKKGAEKYNLALKTKNYDIGVFIEAVGDTENGKDGKYWQYYINGQMPMVAADKKIIKMGDKVEFKFEKSKF